MASSVKAGVKVLGLACALALGVAGCSGGSSNDELPLIKVQIKIKSVSQGGQCETVPVRISPKELAGEANKYANNRMIVTEVTMTGPTDENGAPMCNGSAETLPLAPGKWEFRAPLPSDMVSCVHDVQAGGDLEVAFVDGVPGCGDPEPAGAAPAEGEVAPVDGAVPAEDAPAEGAPADAAAPAADEAAAAPAN